MKLYADMVGGVAGNMILGAMIDCGLPLNYLSEEIGKLNLPQMKFNLEEVERSGIRCLLLNVLTKKEAHHRNFNSIKNIIEDSNLSSKVKEISVKIFRRLAEVEGVLHQTAADEVHFHEIGALDSIGDIVGAAIGLDYFQAEGFYHSEFVLGSGSTCSNHGNLPLPAPATLKLIENFAIRKLNLAGEFTTPTGAAVISTCSLGSLPATPFTHLKSGYGAGNRNYPELPNYLRLWCLQDESIDESGEIVIEANIDDMNPEFFPFLQEKLLANGALDVFYTSVIMKKGRPGILISVTLPHNLLDSIADLIFQHSSTIGLRWYPVNRIKLPRGTCKVNTPWGEIMAKWVEVKGEKRVIPEFEECRRMAREKNIPLFEIYRQIGKNSANL